MPFDVDGARKAGYSDAEIADHLAKQSRFDVAGARSSGYSDAEILQHLASAATPPKTNDRSLVRSSAEGVLRSAAGVGNTLLSPVRAAADILAPEETTASTLVDGKKRRTGPLAPVADYLNRIPEAMKWLEDENAGNPVAFGAGRVVGDIAMTVPVGGLIGAGVKSASARAGIPVLERLGTAVATGGMRTGGAPVGVVQHARDIALRMGGGAINGGASAGLLDPDRVAEGAVVGAAIPPALQAVRGATRAIGATARGIGRAVAPLSERNDPRILSEFLRNNMGNETGKALNRVRQYSQTGPALPGYEPSLSEVARVPSLAALERATTAVDPMAMNTNAARIARNQDVIGNTLDDLAGRDGARTFADNMRETAANRLYQQAYGQAIDPAKLTRPMQKQIKTLMQKPAMQTAMQRARELAQNEGINIADPAGSIRGMHYAKTELDAMIRDAATPNERRILMGVKDDLLTVIDNLSPEYGTARATYESMSRPVNQFDVLEQVASRSRTPAGNVTLNNFARVANDRTAETALRRPGLTLADILDPSQVSQLGAVREALEGATFAQNAGRGVGSDTVQKLATANSLPGSPVLNMLADVVPGGSLVRGAIRGGANALYGSANNRLREKLSQVLLDPAAALPLLEQAAAPPAANSFLNLLQRAGQSNALSPLYRTAPVLLTAN